VVDATSTDSRRRTDHFDAKNSTNNELEQQRSVERIHSPHHTEIGIVPSQPAFYSFIHSFVPACLSAPWFFQLHCHFSINRLHPQPQKKHFLPVHDCELSTFDLSVKINHHAKYLGQMSFRSKVIVRTHTGANALPRPLKWSLTGMAVKLTRL